MANGTVTWSGSQKGFGFIAPEQGARDIFVPITALERAGIQHLDDGQAVTVDIESGRDGRPSAVNLVLAQARAGRHHAAGAARGRPAISFSVAAAPWAGPPEHQRTSTT